MALLSLLICQSAFLLKLKRDVGRNLLELPGKQEVRNTESDAANRIEDLHDANRQNGDTLVVDVDSIPEPRGYHQSEV